MLYFLYHYKVVKELNNKPEDHPNKSDIIDEIRSLDNIISNGYNSRIEWSPSFA